MLELRVLSMLRLLIFYLKNCTRIEVISELFGKTHSF